MSERDKIVAWLRPRVARLDVGEMGEWGDATAAAVGRMDELLNAIERGDHLIRPEPTIPAEEW